MIPISLYSGSGMKVLNKDLFFCLIRPLSYHVPLSKLSLYVSHVLSTPGIVTCRTDYTTEYCVYNDWWCKKKKETKSDLLFSTGSRWTSIPIGTTVMRPPTSRISPKGLIFLHRTYFSTEGIFFRANGKKGKRTESETWFPYHHVVG